jgi:hypothetical protein
MRETFCIQQQFVFTHAENFLHIATVCLHTCGKLFAYSNSLFASCRMHLPTRLSVARAGREHLPIRLSVARAVREHLPIRLSVARAVWEHLPIRLSVGRTRLPFAGAPGGAPVRYPSKNSIIII